MYIGGMGGTGKTHVLQALVAYFNALGESYRLVVVAPTGTAAALIGGSTYHYMFGINDAQGDNISNKLLSEVKSRLNGVDYVFFDEVSMLSCSDLYRISARLCAVFNIYHVPFGGINMIFAGDFAQLPPAYGGSGQSLYSGYVGAKSDSMRDQHAALGKALWHQVLTVVILRQNMRQRSQTIEDSRLWTALENM